MTMTRTMAAWVAAALLFTQCMPLPAYADNQMGYRLLSEQEAGALPRNQGALGLNVERAQQISDGGMTFDLLRVTQVRRGSTGAQAGLKAGDTIIAVDSRVFPTLGTFAAYVGAAQPGSQITVDYMPAGGGPQQAQRVAVAVGQAGQSAAARSGHAVPVNRHDDGGEDCPRRGCGSAVSLLQARLLFQPDEYSCDGDKPVVVAGTVRAIFGTDQLGSILVPVQT